MSETVSSLESAARMIGSVDPTLFRIALLSFEVSGLSVVIASLIALPLGAWLALAASPGDRR